MKIIFTLIFIVTICLTVFSQDAQKTENKHKFKHIHMRISIDGKTFKKLKVDVDFGDSPEQMKAGKEYSDILTNKKNHTQEY